MSRSPHPRRPLARRSVAALAGLAVVTALGACAPQDEGDAGTSASGTGTAAACAKENLEVRTPGKLTVGTDSPAYPPWFVDDKPANGQGYESAVAYAVAEKLGFTKDEVTWVVAGFNAAIAPGPKPFDIDINQISITDERRQNVDFSSPYYDASQAVLVMKGTKAAQAKLLADLAGLRIGAQVGTTSYQAIVDIIKPTVKPSVFNTNDDAKLALANGQVDAIVLDLPTALIVQANTTKDGGLDNSVVVGQLPDSSANSDQFGLVLDKGSPLTACVSQAVDALRSDGTLTKLQTQWLTDTAGAPVLT